MVNVILSSDNVTVLGGPSRLDLDLNVGASGTRGSLIFVLDKEPSEIVLERDFPIAPQVQDIYINDNPASDNFLQAYQFVNQDGIFQWTEIFNLRQDVFNINEVVEFNEGNADIFVNLTSLGLEKIPFSSFSNSFAYFNVSATISNVDLDDVNVEENLYPLPSAVSVFVEDVRFSSEVPAEATDFPLILPIKISAAEFIDNTWSKIDDKKVIVYLTISFANPTKIFQNVVSILNEEDES